MILTAFDLEIAKAIPEDEVDWTRHRPLGISCAGLRYGNNHQLFWGEGSFGRSEAQGLVLALRSYVEAGHMLVGWNIAAFDFAVLAEESGLVRECSELAMGHVDLMFMVVAYKGHYLSLETAARGMGLAGKLTEVKLRDGSTLEEMSGAKAPMLWQEGEHQAVLAYLAEDLRVTLELAEAVGSYNFLRWYSRAGRRQVINTELLTVRDCLEIPLPDTSWMTTPPSRADMLAWVDREVLASDSPYPAR